MKPAPLLVRPRPIIGESMEGYTIRVIARNGWQKPSQLFRELGVHPKTNTSNQNYLDFLKFDLAPRLLMESYELEKSFSYIVDQPWISKNSRSIVDLRVRFPRLCPICVKETGFHWHWSLLFVSHCQKHNHLLWDKCPYCGFHFEWHSKLFKCCPNCDADWVPEKQSNPYHHQDFTNKLLELINSSHRFSWLDSALHDFSSAMLVSLRPFDTLVNGVKHWPVSRRHLCRSIQAAYTLLTDHNYINTWRDRCIDERAEISVLGEGSMLYPVKHFLDCLELDWPVKHKSPAVPRCSNSMNPFPLHPIKAIEVVKPSRMKLATNDRDIYFQTDASGLNNDLGLPRSGADILSTNNIISPINSTQVVRDQLYDQRSFVQLASKIKPLSDMPDGFVDISFYTERLFRFATQFDEILCAILRGRMTALRKRQCGCDLSKLWVHEKTLNDLLISNLKKVCSSAVPIRQASSILKISLDEIRELVRQENLKFARGRGSDIHVDGMTLWLWLTTESVLHSTLIKEFDNESGIGKSNFDPQ